LHRELFECGYLQVGAKKEFDGQVFLPKLQKNLEMAGPNSNFKLFVFEGKMPPLQRKNILAVSPGGNISRGDISANFQLSIINHQFNFSILYCELADNNFYV